MIRRREAELMDDPALDRGRHAAALAALARTNRRLGVDRAVERAARELAREPGACFLDIGAGGGGLLERFGSANGSVLASDGSPERADPLLLGLDFSAQAIELARSWCHPSIRWIRADARRLPLADNSVDVATCTLMLHHFDPPDVVAILREAARVCRRGVVVSDLTRSRTAYAATWLVTRMTSRSRVFHVDGPRSVRAAFRISEMREMARAAGMHGATVRRQFPFRQLLVWRKAAAPAGLRSAEYHNTSSSDGRRNIKVRVQQCHSTNKTANTTW